MPTKHEAPLRIMRAAAMVIISSALYLVSDMRYRLFQTALELIEILSAQHMLLHPGLKSLPLAGDWVPLFIEGVVAGIVPLRVGRKSPALYLAHRAHHPGRQHHGIGRRV